LRGSNKGDFIVKFRSLLGVALALGASVFLSSCGGGGAAATPGNPGGALTILPATGIIYAGVPTTITITGGRTPYTIASGDTTLFPVPHTLNGHSFDVDPPNPSVIDTGIPPGGLPVRTVSIAVQDANGQNATASYQIARNFLTGYGFTFTSQACLSPPTGAASTTIVPTAGCDTVVEVFATINGNIQANQTFKFDAVLGNFLLVDPNTGIASSSVTTATDHNGIASVILRVPSSANTQIGVFRITDVQTGVNTTNAFTIAGNANTSTLTALPSSFTFTGSTTADCGTGQGQFFVFGGQPPYTALSSDSNVTVTAVNATSQPGVFRVTAGNSAVCVNGASIIVTDTGGAHTTVTVTTAAGTATPAAPPPPPLTVQPNTVTLSCGASGSVTVVGGTGGPYSASSTLSDISTTVSGNTVTITRNTGDTSNQPASQTVRITDGSSIVSVTANVPIFCP